MVEAGRAAKTLSIGLEPIGGRGPRRVLVLVAAGLGLLVSFVLQDAKLTPTSRVVVRRTATDEVLATSAVDPLIRTQLVTQMKTALNTSTESEFVERWCDPSTWSSLART